MHRRSHLPSAETPAKGDSMGRGQRRGGNPQFLLPPPSYAEDDSMLNINPQKSALSVTEMGSPKLKETKMTKEEEDFILRHKRRMYTYNPVVLKQ